jgi:hypothetical protein
VVEQLEGMAAAQLVELPVAKREALNLDIEHRRDPVRVRLVGALGPWMAVDPGAEVHADLPRPLRPLVQTLQRLVDRPLGSRLRAKVAL